MSDSVDERSPCAETVAPEVNYITGDVRSVMRSLPDASVDLVLSSPPFLGLRSYLPADDPDKALEIGSESTPGEFIDTLLDIVEECRRVLAPHGSLCFELGDTYAGSGGAGGDYNADGLREGQEKFSGSAAKRRKLGLTENDRPSRARNSQDGRRVRSEDEALGIIAPRRRPGPEGRDHVPGWPLDKSLCLIPESLRWAMVYGRNPFTGRETPRWRARNVVRWCRPNPPVGALADKVRPATSDIIVACTGRSRYFDLDGIREPFTGHAGTGTGVRKGQNGAKPEDNRPNDLATRMNTHDGAPPLDHWWYDDTFDQDAWMVSTEPYHGSHYATWPTKLLVRPIVAMCPQRVCTVCGKASERIVESQRVRVSDGTIDPPRVPPTRDDAEDGTTAIGIRHAVATTGTTVGWTDCGHDSWRAGVVLDPFAGSGTTLAVAHGHGRSAIGIDLDARNADLARERVGMWLITSTHNDTAEAAS